MTKFSFALTIMLKNFILVFLLLISLINFSQVIKDTAVVKYIERKGHASLCDSNNLPNELILVYPNLKGYLTNEKLDICDFYLYSGIKVINDTLVEIPIAHYTGFLKQKKLDDDYEQKVKLYRDSLHEPVGMIIVGDVSGYDRTLIFNLNDQELIEVQFWE